MSSKKISKKVISPIKIKQEKDKCEKDEPKDLCSYIDDRVGLLQQVFMTLKTSKIRTMAPDCIQDMQTDEIKELLLDELLGISTKRLTAIIQGTDCPTDTDSSDDGGIIEHISLDEISDETENEFGSDNESRNRKGAPEQKDSSQMSVLELLELQARARAIRSQLALEPVKEEIIKIDKDEVTPVVKDKAKKNKHDKCKEKSDKRKSNNTDKSSNPIKPIRNYRQSKTKEKNVVNSNESDKSQTVITENNLNETVQKSTEDEQHSSNSEAVNVAAENGSEIAKDNTEVQMNVNEITVDTNQSDDLQNEGDNNTDVGQQNKAENETITEEGANLLIESVVIKQEQINNTQNAERTKKRIKLNRDCIKDKLNVNDNTMNANKSSDSVELNLHFSDTEKELLEQDVKEKSKKSKKNRKTSASSDDCISIQNGDESPFVISSESD